MVALATSSAGLVALGPLVLVCAPGRLVLVCGEDVQSVEVKRGVRWGSSATVMVVRSVQ